MEKRKDLDLLKYLALEGTWMKSKDLALFLSVSERTVRNYVKSINAASSQKPILSSEQGYRINPDLTQDQRKALLELYENDIPVNRVFYIIRTLIRHDSSIDLGDLEDELFISRSTLELDLKKIKELLTSHQAELQRTDQTIRLIADENTRRKLMTFLFYEEKKQNTIDLGLLEEAFGVDLGPFYTQVLSILESEYLYLNEFALGNILVHILVALERVQSGRMMATMTSMAFGQQEHIASQMICETIEKEFKVHFDTAESHYIAMLLSSRVNQADTLSQDEKQDELVDLIIRLVQEEYLIDLKDRDFLNRFIAHVSNLVQRAQSNSLNRNPLSTYIKEMYPLTYDLSVFIAQIIEKHYEIRIIDDEIAFIAFHIAAFLEPKKEPKEKLNGALISSNYHQMTASMKAKILDHFGIYISEITVLSPFQLDSLDTYDFIITTCQIDKPIDKPVVQVAPILRQADLDAIYHVLTSINAHKKISSSKEALFRLFDPRFIAFNTHFNSEWEVIHTLSSLLKKAGYVDDQFEQNIVDREKVSSTAFNNIIAVPHGLKMTALKSAIYVILNDQPIPWGNSSVRLVALFAMNKEDKKLFVDIFDNFIEVVGEIDNVHELLKSKTYEQFVSTMGRMV